MQIRRALAGLLGFGLVAASSPAARVEPSAADGLLARYHCEVTARLLLIELRPKPADEQNRFLILSRADAPQDYVQCAFTDLDREVICEAASGAYLDVPRTMYLPAPAIAALGRLGFTTDGSHENFKLRRDGTNLAAIADLMLTALAVGFDATAGTELTFDAPDAPDDTGLCADDAWEGRCLVHLARHARPCAGHPRRDIAAAVPNEAAAAPLGWPGRARP